VSASEPTVVVGVVHPHGCNGVSFGNTQQWTLQFAFETWRSEDGILHTTELAIRRQVTHDELRSYMDRIKSYKVLSVRVIFTSPSSAELLEIVGQTLASNDPLLQRATELLMPQTREHDQFGTLTLVREIDVYQANVLWDGKEVRLYLATADDAQLDAALRTAAELFKDQTTWSNRIQEYAVQKLLDLKNTVWLDEYEDEHELTPEEFKGRMSLETIGVYPNGQFEFLHDDGGLFFGHAIQVTGNLLEGPTDADIPG